MGNIEVSVNKVGDGSKQVLELDGEAQIEDLLEKHSQNLETVVVKRNGMIVTEEEELTDGDNVEIIPIVSGG